MHKNATKCNETICKWCKNKHGASKIIDTFETYQRALDLRVPPRQSHLVWVRRELVRGKSFLVVDCYPTGCKKLSIPTKTSLSRDLWSVKIGVATFAQVVEMIGGGRGAGRTRAGRGNNQTKLAPSSARTVSHEKCL
jgi:hypothetical protein